MLQLANQLPALDLDISLVLLRVFYDIVLRLGLELMVPSLTAQADHHWGLVDPTLQTLKHTTIVTCVLIAEGAIEAESVLIPSQLGNGRHTFAAV